MPAAHIAGRAANNVRARGRVLEIKDANAAEYLVAQIRQEPLELPAEIETRQMVRETTVKPQSKL